MPPPKLSAAAADLLDRRGFLGHAATAAGAMALVDLLARDGVYKRLVERQFAG